MKIIALLLASVEASKLTAQTTSVPPGGFDYGDEYYNEDAVLGIDVYSLADSGLIDYDQAFTYDLAVDGFNDAITDYEYAAEELKARTEEINDALNSDDWYDDYDSNTAGTDDFGIDWDDLPDYDDGTFVESGDSNWDYYIDPETGAYLPVNGGTEEPEEPEEDFD